LLKLGGLSGEAARWNWSMLSRGIHPTSTHLQGVVNDSHLHSDKAGFTDEDETGDLDSRMSRLSIWL
jgi:hypothetical protein